MVIKVSCPHTAFQILLWSELLGDHSTFLSGLFKREELPSGHASLPALITGYGRVDASFQTG